MSSKEASKNPGLHPVKGQYIPLISFPLQEFFFFDWPDEVSYKGISSFLISYLKSSLGKQNI